MRRVWVAALLLLPSTGCISISYSESRQDTALNKPLPQVDWSKHKAYFKGWTHNYVAARATATGSHGASASSTVIATTSKVPADILELANEHLPFDLVTATDLGVGKRPTYFLEGNLADGPPGYEYGMPWWTWVQLLDLWIHAWIFPTLGSISNQAWELRLTDREGRLIGKWYAWKQIRTLNNLWGLFGKQRVDGKALARRLFEKAGESLRAALPPPAPTPDRSGR